MKDVASNYCICFLTEMQQSYNSSHTLLQYFSIFHVAGLKFIHKNAELLLSRYTHGKFSRWIAIVLPGMVELARASSLEVVFPESVDRALADLFINRRQILER